MRSAVAYQRRLGPVTSPVVSAAISRKVDEVRASTALRRAIACICLTFIVLLDWNFSVSSLFISGWGLLLLQYAEVVAIVILLLSFLHDVTVYLSTHFMQTRIQITSDQCKMLGVKRIGSGYDLVQNPIPFGEPLSSTPLAGHTPMHPYYYMTPLSSNHSSPHTTPYSSSTQTPTPSSSRGHSVPRGYRASPFSKEPVADAHSLECYLKQEEEKEQLLLRGSLDLTPSQAGYGGHSPSPRKYHIAPRSCSPSFRHRDYETTPYRKQDTSFESCGVKKADLERWTERCRKWIAKSVVVPLAEEINSLNSKLTRKGISEQIGTAPIKSLKQMARSKAQHLPTLSLVIPYLEVSGKQEYLVERIKELALGTYMSEYNWNSGGKWKGRPWSIDLPYDSQIVMHLLSTYLDNHLPPDPWFPDGKTFSTQYFRKAPPRNGGKKPGVCIIQDNNNPPIYKVLVNGNYIEIPEGRNNLFHSICIFLHHVKEKEKSMLGSNNLETAGINILTIISPN